MLKLLTTFCLLLCMFLPKGRAQVDAVQTSSYIYNNYYLAPPLAERNRWFIPESFAQLSAFTGHAWPDYPVRNVSLVGNYSFKPDWGYTYRPILTWWGFGGIFGKTWHPDFRESTYAPSAYYTIRTKMKNFDHRFDPPAKISFFLQPQWVRYKVRKKSSINLEKRNKFNVKGGAVFYKHKYYAGIQFNRLFTNTVRYTKNGTDVALVYPNLFSAFGSYRLKYKKLYLFRPTLVAYYTQKEFHWDAMIERDFFVKKGKWGFVPIDLNLFAVGAYSELNKSMAISVGMRRIAWNRLDGYYKFQKVLDNSAGTVRAIHEISAILRIGPQELDRPDFVDRD